MEDKSGLIAKYLLSILAVSPKAGPTSRRIKSGHSRAKRTVQGEMIHQRAAQAGSWWKVLQLQGLRFQTCCCTISMTWCLVELIQNFSGRKTLFLGGSGPLNPPVPLRSLSRDYSLRFMASQCLQKYLAEENSFYRESPEGYEDHLFILTL